MFFLERRIKIKHTTGQSKKRGGDKWQEEETVSEIY